MNLSTQSSAAIADADAYSPGARPLGLMSVNGAFLSSLASHIATVVYGMESSVRIMATYLFREISIAFKLISKFVVPSRD